MTTPRRDHADDEPGSGRDDDPKREPGVDDLDPDAPGRSLFDDEGDAVEPNEPA